MSEARVIANIITEIRELSSLDGVPKPILEAVTREALRAFWDRYCEGLPQEQVRTLDELDVCECGAIAADCVSNEDVTLCPTCVEVEMEQNHNADEAMGSAPEDPRTEVIARVRSWPAQDTCGLLDFVASIWRYDNHIWREGDTWHIATGGWSGNETIIDAMQENVGWWALAWQESKRGGHHVFRPLTAPEPQPRAVPVTRTRVDQMTPGELAIREAMQAVEAAGADERLTQAVCLLEEASAKVYAFALDRESKSRTVECVVVGEPWSAVVTPSETFGLLRARALAVFGVTAPDEIEMFDQRGRRCEPEQALGEVERVYFSRPVGLGG